MMHGQKNIKSPTTCFSQRKGLSSSDNIHKFVQGKLLLRRKTPLHTKDFHTCAKEASFFPIVG